MPASTNIRFQRPTLTSSTTYPVSTASTTPGTSSSTSYPGHSMNRSQADLGITAAVAAFACAAAAVGAPVAVMTVLGIVLFAAPGYLSGQLLLGSHSSVLERLAVATGLAFCVPILGGLLLYAAGLPLHRAAWFGLLAGVTLVCDVVLFLRRRGGRRA